MALGYSPRSPLMLSQSWNDDYDGESSNSGDYSRNLRISSSSSSQRSWEQSVLGVFPWCKSEKSSLTLLAQIIIADESEALAFALKSGLVLCRKGDVRSLRFDDEDNRDYLLPVHFFAVYHRAKRCLALLLENCNAKALAKARDPRSGCGIVFYAIAMNVEFAIFEVIVAYDRGNSVVQFFEETDANCDNALHAMVKKRENVKTIELIAGHYTRLIMRFNRQYCSPFHCAAQNPDSSDVLALFIKIGSNVIGVDFLNEKTRLSALHYAAQSASSVCVDELVRRGAIHGQTAKNGYYPIHVAAYYGNLDIVKMFVGADANAIKCLNANYETPAMVAAKNGCVNVLSFLLGISPSVEEQRTNQGESILHYAVRSDKQNVVAYLNKTCPNLVLSRSTNGWSPLYLSIYNDHPTTFLALMESSQLARNEYAVNTFSLTYMALRARSFRVLSVIHRQGFLDFTKTFFGGNTLLHLYLQEEDATLDTVKTFTDIDESVVLIKNDQGFYPASLCADESIAEYLYNVADTYLSSQLGEVDSSDESFGESSFSSTSSMSSPCIDEHDEC